MCTRLGLLHMGTSWCVLTGGSGNTHDRPPSERKKGTQTFQHRIPQVLGGSRGCLRLRTIQMAPLKFPFSSPLKQLTIFRTLSLQKKSIQEKRRQDTKLIFLQISIQNTQGKRWWNNYSRASGTVRQRTRQAGMEEKKTMTSALQFGKASQQAEVWVLLQGLLRNTSYGPTVWPHPFGQVRARGHTAMLVARSELCKKSGVYSCWVPLSGNPFSVVSSAHLLAFILFLIDKPQLHTLTGHNVMAWSNQIN